MKRKYRIVAFLLLSALSLFVVGLWVVSDYMLGYSLCPERDAYDVEGILKRKSDEYPWQREWLDSLCDHAGLHDINMRSTVSDSMLHAVCLPAVCPTERTALLVHGYGCCSLDMLHIAFIYHRLLGMNVLMPDLYGHGLSRGDHVNMGWLDRLDVLQWSAVADSLFGGGTRMVLHGISMGGATVMMASGECLPPYVCAFVDDCGYTSVWDEFSSELYERFNLSSSLLMCTTSLLCRHRYGWSFQEADCVSQVIRCRLPMLFIHGEKDTFVPTRMVSELFRVKPEPKRIWIAKGSKHARSYADHPDEYASRVASFINEYIPQEHEGRLLVQGQ